MSAVGVLLTKAPRLYHGAFDIRDGVMVVGFSAADKVVRIASDGTLVVADVGDELKLGDTVLRFAKARASQLPSLDGQWQSADLGSFLKDQVAPTGAQLYAKVRDTWKRFVDFDHVGKYVITSGWTIMTYVYPLFASLPFLHFVGPKGSGKSQALDLLQQLSRVGIKTRPTVAAIGDLVASQRPTLLFDQSDNLSSEHIDLLTDSNRLGARRTIVDVENRGAPMEFETFGLKAFAGTKVMPTDLADRTIQIVTLPAKQTPPAVMPNDLLFADIRNQLYRWSMKSFATIPLLAPYRSPETWTGLTQLTGRQRDLWLPIETILEAVAAPDADRKAAREYYQRSQVATRAELDDETVQLLRLLRSIVGDASEATITSSELLMHLNFVPSSDDGIALGLEPWTAQQLGLKLQALAVVKENRRIDSNRHREYVIDGPAVRSLSERYGLTD